MALFYADKTAPASKAFAVAPSNSTDLPDVIRAVTIGGGGTLSYLNLQGETCTTAELPAGTYPLFARRIRTSGTTATQITGWV